LLFGEFLLWKNRRVLKVSRAFFEKYGSKWPYYEEKSSKVAIFRE
jgi:hypothetical protein